MDVQMPVIDGYRATHLIRHHPPYKETSGRIPIIAMTASAIQGDREKCMRAGMDDYIAKPVKGRTLEKALDRWAVEGRGRREGGGEGAEADEKEKQDNAYADSECTEGERGENGGECGRTAKMTTGSGSSSTGKVTSHSEALTAPDPELVDTEEEKVLKLRLEQLAEAAGQEGREGLGPCALALTEGQELTEENVGRLERESSSGGGGRGSNGSGSMRGSEVVEGGSDVDVGGAEPSASKGASSCVEEQQRRRRQQHGRPQMQRWPDSQKTITGL